MYAVSQGALGIECRRNDLLVIQMLNELNHEDTLLGIIAERTFLAKLEGGCSAPVGVTSRVTKTSVCLEGCVLDQEGKQRLFDKFEIKFESSLVPCDCPIVSLLRQNELTNLTNENDESKFVKRKLNDLDEATKKDDENKDNDENENENIHKKMKRIDSDHSVTEEILVNAPHFSFIIDLKVDSTKLSKAELCGLHLANKMKEQGADVIIRECKAQILKS
jgi:hypothetical protein